MMSKKARGKAQRGQHDMWAESCADLPIFSGTPPTVEVQEFRPEPVQLSAKAAEPDEQLTLLDEATEHAESEKEQPDYTNATTVG